VTNTPWGERVTFVFDPKGQRVQKALHVSPFMDMDNVWCVAAGAARQARHCYPGTASQARLAGRGSSWPRDPAAAPQPLAAQLAGGLPAPNLSACRPVRPARAHQQPPEPPTATARPPPRRILNTPAPSERLQLSVLVDHPQHGRYFDAFLVARRCKDQAAGARNEEAGLRALLRYGFAPQRAALLIYWQAVKLLWKGVGRPRATARVAAAAAEECAQRCCRWGSGASR
jgi:hypothetical protein